MKSLGRGIRRRVAVAKGIECSLGSMLRRARIKQKLTLRQVASNAGISPMYLSLLERDACGAPSDEKLQALADALGESHSEIFFAKAGRVHPRVARIILQYPTQWTQLLEAGKDLDSDHIASLKTIVDGTPGVGKTLAFLHIIRESQARASSELAGQNTAPGIEASNPAMYEGFSGECANSGCTESTQSFHGESTHVPERQAHPTRKTGN
jgi:transcriptional regulator with XRE-family HTH domain